MKTLLLLNIIALLAAVYLAILQPIFTDVDIRMRYVQLDRAGAIVVNREVLTTFHPSYGFSEDDERNTVPGYIAQPAFARQKFNAFLMLGLALVNVAVVLLIRRHKDPSRQAEGSANIGQPQSPPSSDQPPADGLT